MPRRSAIYKLVTKKLTDDKNLLTTMQVAWELVVTEAELVHPEHLRKIHPDLPRAFFNLYLPGIRGWRDATKLIRNPDGLDKSSQWSIWWEQNRSEAQVPFPATRFLSEEEIENQIKANEAEEEMAGDLFRRPTVPPAAADKELLIDANTFAKMILHVSAATFARMKRAGHLPRPVVLGKRVLRWRVTDISAWLSARQATSPSGDSQPGGSARSNK